MPQRATSLPATRLRSVTRLAPAPDHLGETEAALFRRLVQEFAIDDSGSISLLTVACEAHQRMREAREEVAEHGGTTFKDRFGQLRQHPAVAIERDARNDYLRAMRVLNLKPDPAVR
jgi:P27 family predicted phage terminase small subunit